MRLDPWIPLPLCILSACGGEDARAPAPGPPAAPAPGPALVEASAAGTFDDEAAERGLEHHNRSGSPEKRTILEANGAGVALLDLERDGDLDLIFAQGLASLEQLLAGPGADLEVFRNDGSGRFRRAPGPGLSGWWTGLATGDFDGDGATDLVAGGFGALELLLQGPEGELRRAGSLLPEGPERLEPGRPREKGHPPAWVTSIAPLDLDRDGLLDLYVGLYLELDPLDPPIGEVGEGELALPCRWKGHEVYCGPRGLVPQADRLLRGLGGGRFADESAERLPGKVAGYTLALLPLDADGDGDTDLLVANDSSANLALINDGRGVFTDHGYEAGFAFSMDGRPEAGMGLAAGDVNRDLVLDVALTNFSDEPTALYFGSRTGFSNETYRYGLGAQSRALLSWSVHLSDFDGDGWLDLFTANGHVYPQADREGTGTSYAQADTLWRLGPQARARRVEPAGERSILALRRGTRGSALGDLDGDGAPDLALSYIDAPAGLGMNRLGGASRRLVLALAGPAEVAPRPPRTPRDATGARALVEVGEGAARFGLVSELYTCAGYQSASSPHLHFGLGEHERYAAITIRWPSGRVEELPGGPANRRLWIEEGRGIVRAEELR